MNSVEINNWVKERNLLPFNCINEIKSMPKQEFIKKYGVRGVLMKVFSVPEPITEKFINDKIKLVNPKFQPLNKDWLKIRIKWKKDNKKKQWCDKKGKLLDENTWFKKVDINPGSGRKKRTEKRRAVIFYENKVEKLGIYFYPEKHNTLPKQTNDVLKKTPYVVDGDMVIYSKLKERYTKKNTNHGYKNDKNDDFIKDASIALPKNYYWKTPDKLLIYHNENKQHFYSADILRPEIESDSDDDDIDNNPAKVFVTNNIKKSSNPRLRTGLSDINKAYKKYCKQNETEPLTRLVLKEILTNLGFTEEKTKGISISNKLGKRGYNVEINNII